MKHLRASVTYPNTPESDLEQEVIHTVTYITDDGMDVSEYLLATDPMDAINKVLRSANNGKTNSEKNDV